MVYGLRRSEALALRWDDIDFDEGTVRTDEGLVTTTRLGNAVLPRSLDRALALIIEKSGLPRLTSHGLRHTAATHMVKGATNLNEL